MHKIAALVSGILIATSLTACGSYGPYPFLYHPPVQQGNIINPAAFQMLKPGMNKAEVVNMVGEPILQTPFSPNVWHYVYTMRVKNRQTARQEITLYFSGDTLINIVGL